MELAVFSILTLIANLLLSEGPASLSLDSLFGAWSASDIVPVLTQGLVDFGISYSRSNHYFLSQHLAASVLARLSSMLARLSAVLR